MGAVVAKSVGNVAVWGLETAIKNTNSMANNPNLSSEQRERARELADRGNQMMSDFKDNK